VVIISDASRGPLHRRHQRASACAVVGVSLFFFFSLSSQSFFCARALAAMSIFPALFACAAHAARRVCVRCGARRYSRYSDFPPSRVLLHAYARFRSFIGFLRFFRRAASRHERLSREICAGVLEIRRQPPIRRFRRFSFPAGATLFSAQLFAALCFLCALSPSLSVLRPQACEYFSLFQCVMRGELGFRSQHISESEFPLRADAFLTIFHCFPLSRSLLSFAAGSALYEVAALQSIFTMAA